MFKPVDAVLAIFLAAMLGILLAVAVVTIFPGKVTVMTYDEFMRTY